MEQTVTRTQRISLRRGHMGFARALVAALTEPETGWWPKFWALLALLYVLWPLDLVPDLVPLVGWLDDLGVFAVAFTFLARSARRYQRKIEETDA